MLRVGAVARNGGRDLLVNDDIDLDTCLGPPLQHLIQPPLLVEVGRSSEENLWTQPPVFDVDDVLCLFQRDTDGPEVVTPVDIPLDLVSVSFRGKGLEAVGFGNALTFGIGFLLVLFVVTMVRVDEVVELADFGLEMVETLFGIVEVGICNQRSMWELRSDGGGMALAHLSSFPAALGRDQGA